MYKTGMSEKEALDHIRRKRAQIDPNIGFIGQLMSFNENLRAVKASLFHIKVSLQTGPKGIKTSRHG